MALLQRMANQSGGGIDFASLGKLASGNVGGPSEDDRRLVQQTIGATADIGQRELQRTLGPLMAQLNEQNAGRNIGGSSIEGLNKALAGQEMAGRLADLLSGAQAQGGQALLNLPFQRNEQMMGANAQLFQMLTGSANPVLQGNLMARTSQPTTTQTQNRGWMDVFNAAAGIGGLPFGGMFGGGGGGGSSAMNPSAMDSMPSSFNPYPKR